MPFSWCPWWETSTIAVDGTPDGTSYLWSPLELAWPWWSTLSSAFPEGPGHWGRALLKAVRTYYSRKHPQTQPLSPSPANLHSLSSFSQAWMAWLQDRLSRSGEADSSPTWNIVRTDVCWRERTPGLWSVQCLLREAGCFLLTPGFSWESPSE